jgi:hypothetical protein
MFNTHIVHLKNTVCSYKEILYCASRYLRCIQIKAGLSVHQILLRIQGYAHKNSVDNIWRWIFKLDCFCSIICCEYVASVIDELMIREHRSNSSNKQNRSSRGKPCLSADLSILISTWSGLGLSSALYGERPTTKSLSDGTNPCSCLSRSLTFS